MAKEAKNWQKGKVQNETFLSAKWALLSLHPLVYNHRAEQQHDCPTSRWPAFSRNALVIRPLASDTRRFYPGSLSFLPFLPCLSLWMPSRHAGSAENSSAAWLKVAVIIKSEVEAETRHGKNPTLSGIVQKRKKKGGKGGEWVLRSCMYLKTWFEDQWCWTRASPSGGHTWAPCCERDQDPEWA